MAYVEHSGAWWWRRVFLCIIGWHKWKLRDEEVQGSWGATWTVYTFQCRYCGIQRVRTGDYHNDEC